MKILSGQHKGYRLPSVQSPNVRPTLEKIRAQLFNILQVDIEDAVILDLFAGTGSLGLEGLSRGARSCTFVEHERRQAESIKGVLKEWNAQGDVFSLHVLQAIHFLNTHQHENRQKYTICLLDPPYSQTDPKNAKVVVETMKALDASSILAEGARVFLEDSFKSDIDAVAFEHLEVVKSRRSGDTCLREYIYK